jgi:enoyl-CoA hydratase/carnithine racemase
MGAVARCGPDGPTIPEVEYGPLHATADGGIVTVVIDHPPTNLLDGFLLEGLRSLLDDLEGDSSARVVIFRSADPDFFVMHGDVELLVGLHPAYVPATDMNAAAATLERFTTAPFVSIGLLDGAARGGGCELLLAMDVRFGTDRAVVAQPEVAMGILPGAGGSARWPRLVSRSRALDILLTGRDVGAAELLALGWLHSAGPSERLEEELTEFAARLACMPAASVAAVKRVLNVSLAGMETALVAESDELGRLLASGAHRAPMRRFLDAGGQTRDGETTGMAAVVDAMLASPEGA